MTIAFIDQASRDIKKKFQRLEGLQDKLLRDLVQVAEKVYHNRETEEEKEQRKRKEEHECEIKKGKLQKRNLQRILATVIRESREERLQPKRARKTLEKDKCPNKWKPGAGNTRPWEKCPQTAKVLVLREDSN